MITEFKSNGKIVYIKGTTKSNIFYLMLWKIAHTVSLDILFKINYSWEETVGENTMIIVNITGNTMDVYLGKENAFWKDFISY